MIESGLGRVFWQPDDGIFVFIFKVGLALVHLPVLNLQGLLRQKR